MKKILIPLTIALLIAIVTTLFIYNSPDHRISRSMNLAKSLFDEGQWEEAKVELNKIIEIDATNLDAHIMLADVYKNLNDTENQIAVYEKIIEIAPKREETYLDYAEIYIAKEDWQKAREILQLGVDNTSGQKVKDKLAEVEKIIADIEEAERIAQEEAEKAKQKELDFEKLMNIKVMGKTVEEISPMSMNEFAQFMINYHGMWNDRSWKFEGHKMDSYKNSKYYSHPTYFVDGFIASSKNYCNFWDNCKFPGCFYFNYQSDDLLGLYFFSTDRVDRYVEMPQEFRDYNYWKKYGDYCEKCVEDKINSDKEVERLGYFYNHITGKTTRWSISVYFDEKKFSGLNLTIYK